jgi:DNA-directed RNA polymerase specialized sigma24 family protein
MATLCEDCDKRDACRTPCEAVRWYLWQGNPGVMEKHHKDKIVVYPKRGEVHYAELSDQQQDQISDSNVVPWSSGDLKKRQSTVFVERFFNKVPCKELAERFGVKENTVVTMYRHAVAQLEKIVEALDARREGLKATKSGRFTDDQKMFLLVEVFGFNRVEVARMFKQEHKTICAKLKRMSDKYKEAFSNPSP